MLSLKGNVEVSSSAGVKQHNSFENLALTLSESERKGEKKDQEVNAIMYFTKHSQNAYSAT